MTCPRDGISIGLARLARAAIALATALALWAAPSGRPAAAQTISTTPAPTDVPLPTCDQVSLDVLVVALFEDTFDTTGNGGGRPNDVLLKNCFDGKLKVRGSVQLNRIGGPTVEPVNLAFAYGQCADCQTLAVSLQLNLYRQGATYISPKNAATAVNFQCPRCLTVAWALQYSFGVDDPSQLPPRMANLINAMDQQFKFMARSSDQLTLAEAEGQIDAILQQFADLATNLTDTRDQRTDDGAVATATPLPAASPTPSPSASPTLGASPSPTSGAASSPAAATSPMLTPTPSPSAAPPLSDAPTATATAAPPSASPTSTPSAL